MQTCPKDFAFSAVRCSQVHALHAIGGRHNTHRQLDKLISASSPSPRRTADPEHSCRHTQSSCKIILGFGRSKSEHPNRSFWCWAFAIFERVEKSWNLSFQWTQEVSKFSTEEIKMTGRRQRVQSAGKMRGLLVRGYPKKASERRSSD